MEKAKIIWKAMRIRLPLEYNKKLMMKRAETGTSMEEIARQILMDALDKEKYS